jgi:L-rhamnose mutarotase
MVGAVLMFIAILAAQENTGTIAVLRLSPDARGAAMSWNELAAGIGSFLGIGTGSIGLALGGISGLGIALVMIAVAGTLLSRVALAVSIHLDQETNTLFGVLWRRKDHTMANLPAHPVMQRWWAHMADIMETKPDNEPVAVPLETLFHME